MPNKYYTVQCQLNDESPFRDILVVTGVSRGKADGYMAAIRSLYPSRRHRVITSKVYGNKETKIVDEFIGNGKLGVHGLSERMDFNPSTLFPKALSKVEKVMIEGEKKYPQNNWGNADDHYDHAEAHLANYPHEITGDDSIKELSHAITRLLMELEILLCEVEN